MLKAGILYVLAVIFGIGGADRWLFTLGLAQAGEFGFVLLSFTVSNAVLPQAVADQLLLSVALSMLLTPALFILYDKVVAPRFGEAEESGDDDDVPAWIDHHCGPWPVWRHHQSDAARAGSRAGRGGLQLCTA